MSTECNSLCSFLTACISYLPCVQKTLPQRLHKNYLQFQPYSLSFPKKLPSIPCCFYSCCGRRRERERFLFLGVNSINLKLYLTIGQNDLFSLLGHLYGNLVQKKVLRQPLLISILNKAKATDCKILSTRLEGSNKYFATITEYP